jgi:hypothetical protein
MKWRLMVILACAVVVAAYAFVFREGITHPYLFSMPYTLWVGILVTAIMVVLTYLGAKSFPHQEK